MNCFRVIIIVVIIIINNNICIIIIIRSKMDEPEDVINSQENQIEALMYYIKRLKGKVYGLHAIKTIRLL
jgi:hypothetical protein